MKLALRIALIVLGTVLVLGLAIGILKGGLLGGSPAGTTAETIGQQGPASSPSVGEAPSEFDSGGATTQDEAGNADSGAPKGPNETNGFDAKPGENK